MDDFLPAHFFVSFGSRRWGYGFAMSNRDRFVLLVMAAALAAVILIKEALSWRLP